LTRFFLPGCCPPREALQRLLQEAGQHPVGGILALPVADTLKRGNGENHIAETLSRSGLWQAQTPQLFPAALLQRALAAANPAHFKVNPVWNNALSKVSEGHQTTLGAYSRPWK